jgi:hypothetical protein
MLVSRSGVDELNRSPCEVAEPRDALDVYRFVGLICPSCDGQTLSRRVVPIFPYMSKLRIVQSLSENIQCSFGAYSLCCKMFAAIGGLLILRSAAIFRTRASIISGPL